jgi:dipeptidyl aminopeptidase/acylaminoacyl peptidase
VLYEDEGHGFEDPENAIDFLKRIEAFLKKYNPADDQLVSAR